jgi:hypothetical protein
MIKLSEIIQQYETIGDHKTADILDNFLFRHARAVANRRMAQYDQSEEIDWTQPDAWKQTLKNKQTEASPIKNEVQLESLPKDTRRMIELMRSGKVPGELSRKEFEKIVRSLGFDVADTTKHFAISHPDLVGHPIFETGVIASLNDHAHGQKGRMHFKAMEDLKDAIRYMHPHFFNKNK